MPKEEWGVKRVCTTTGKRFYDLNRSPIISPYTGEVVDIELAQRKMSVSAVTRTHEAKPDNSPLVDDLDTDDDLLEAASSDDLDSDLLEDDSDDDNVSLDELADVAADEDDS